MTRALAHFFGIAAAALLLSAAPARADLGPRPTSLEELGATQLSAIENTNTTILTTTHSRLLCYLQGDPDNDTDVVIGGAGGSNGLSGTNWPDVGVRVQPADVVVWTSPGTLAARPFGEAWEVTVGSGAFAVGDSVEWPDNGGDATADQGTVVGFDDTGSPTVMVVQNDEASNDSQAGPDAGDTITNNTQAGSATADAQRTQFLRKLCVQ